ncbi:hypothetical protein [Streptomyces sp. AK04-3B]|uniref:hypothetical protein n=1 Tax=Streptomyces sp. AK04-3B TaxID=3028650 RepID=UPI0029A2CD03|nr:hypothetical protein [Streptomyces sp. AK04-3B]MDX3799499.1 hypothetical protein [Streptomyces sp. AK04-3B]
MNAWNRQGGQPPHDPYHPPYGPYGPQPLPQRAPRVGVFRRLWRAVGPIAVGRTVFRPSRPGRVDDAAVTRMQRIRTAVGLAAVVWVTISYKLVASVGDLADDRVDQAWNNVLVLAVTLPLVVGALIGAARPPARRELLRRAAGPLGSIVAIIAAVALFPAAVLTGLLDGRFATGPATTVITVVVALFMIVWVLPFVVYGVGMSLVHVFRTADIHETVPPLLALVLVWEMAVIDVFTGAYEGVPGPVRILLLLGAPLSVTAVALWELRRLRVGYGLTLRAALMR